jgi:hypothetical protein
MQTFGLLVRGLNQMSKLPLVFLLLFCASNAFSAGQTSANFLKIAVGAKNASMGETGAAETGINAIYWNPAGLATVEYMEVSFMHAAWLEGINYENAAYARRLGDSGVLGVSLDYLTMSPIDGYDNTGGRQASFYPSDNCLKITYAADISATPEQTCVGVTLKYITSYISTLSARTLAIDAGIYFDTIFEDLRFGVVFQNLGKPMKYDNKAYSLPLNLKAGVNYLFTENLSASLDLNKSIDADTVLNTGAEYLYPISDETAVALRGGYRTNNERLGGNAGITIGLGLIYKSFNFDYAFVPYGDLSDTHRITVGYKF